MVDMMKENEKKKMTAFQKKSILLIGGILSPLLLFVGLNGQYTWLTGLASVLIVLNMLAVILVK
jgi:hypothetical protein